MYTRRELASMYNVSVNTMLKIIKRVGIHNPITKRVTPLEFEELKKAIGEPVNPILSEFAKRQGGKEFRTSPSDRSGH